MDKKAQRQLIVDLWELTRAAFGAAECEAEFYKAMKQELERLRPLVQEAIHG